MTDKTYDAIIIGSGAGGSTVAYNLVHAGKRVLILEKGDVVPRDSSTLDVKTVFKEGRYKSHELTDSTAPLCLASISTLAGKPSGTGSNLSRLSENLKTQIYNHKLHRIPQPWQHFGGVVV